VRSPDASWVLSSRWNALTEAEQEAFPRIAPDFVAEVRSKSDSLVELRRKMKEYVEQGVRLAWLIDPESRLVEIYRPGREPELVSNAERISGEPELSWSLQASGGGSRTNSSRPLI
jgi:Uma2 family endonuclease